MSDKTRDEYRDEAVSMYGEAIFGLFKDEPEYRNPDGPDKFREILVNLWEDGATIGFHDG